MQEAAHRADLQVEVEAHRVAQLPQQQPKNHRTELLRITHPLRTTITQIHLAQLSSLIMEVIIITTILSMEQHYLILIIDKALIQQLDLSY